MWMWSQSVILSQELVHLDGLAALAHGFTLVGKSLMAAELSSLCEAAVATLAPVTHTHKHTEIKTHKTDDETQ